MRLKVDSPVIATHGDSKSPHRHLVNTPEGVCEVVCESVLGLLDCNPLGVFVVSEARC